MFKIGDTVKILQIPRNSFDFSFEKQAISGEVLTITSKVWDYVFDEFIYSVYSERLKETLWFRKKYLMLIQEDKKMSKFKVGDRVRVVEKVEFENGWANSWISDMNEAIGNTYTIERIGNSGVVFKEPIKQNGFNYYYGFPPSSLELVASESKENSINTSNNRPKFKPGDKVLIARKVTRQEGWNNSWSNSMDSYIGKESVIDRITTNGVYFVSKNFADFGFPSDALELVVKTNTVYKNYQYFRDLGNRQSSHNLCLTFATEIVKYDNGTALVNWSVAFKHPKDEFNKSLARSIVDAKETKEMLLEKGYTRNTIILKILCDLFYHSAYLSEEYKTFVVSLINDYSYTGSKL